MPLFSQDLKGARSLVGAPVPAEWEGATTPYSLDRSVLDFFRERALAAPNSIAVEQHPRSMTYAELDAASDRIAFELQRRGLRLDEIVAVFLPASCGFIAAILGVLKAGGCYLPIELDTPEKRLDFILKDSECRFELTDCDGAKRLHGRFGEALIVADLISGDSDVAAPSTIPSAPSRRVYLSYTSGSTGRPKGVQIEHRSLTNLVLNYIEQLRLGPQDRSSLLAYLAFDVSMADIWPVLCAGGTLVVPPTGLRRNPDSLIAWLGAQNITLAFIPTGLAEVLFFRKWSERMALRWLTTGGDRLRVRPPAGLPFTVLNGYGPTESTVFATWAEIAPDAGEETSPPIGRPLHNVTAYVLEEARKRVPVGGEGELFLGGVQVARGYLNRDELTAQAFLPDPFANKPEARMYRTGDWVRWLPSGQLEFIGRRDGQIQVRGGRVELGEIEAVLFAHEGVRQACCVPLFESGMPMGLVAHIVPKTLQSDLARHLRTYLAEHFPAYMLPAQIVAHEALPLTPQGKIDRAALQALQADVKVSTRDPENEASLDERLAQLWHDTLPSAAGARPGATFTELGGDSLLAIKVLLRVEELSGRLIDFSTFAREPTLAGLQRIVRQRPASSGPQIVVPLRKEGSRPPLFCLYNVAGDVNVYSNLAEALGADQPVYGIRSPAADDPNRLPQSIEQAASEVLPWIREIQPQGAPALLGYSWGGLLGFEIARQFLNRDGVACFCALLGTSAPPRPSSAMFRVGHFAAAFPNWLAGLLSDTGNMPRRLLRWRQMARNARQTLVAPIVPPPDWARLPLSRHLMDLAAHYRPSPPSPIGIHLFRERDIYSRWAHPLAPWETDHLADGGWGRWTLGEVRVHWINGDHLSIMGPPHVQTLADEIRRSMDCKTQAARAI